MRFFNVGSSIAIVSLLTLSFLGYNSLEKAETFPLGNNKNQASIVTSESKETQNSCSETSDHNLTSSSDWREEGFYLRYVGCFEEALAAFNKALEIDSGDANAWFGRGNTLRSLRRYEESVTSYDKAIDILPKYAAAWGNRGHVLNELGRYQEALESLDKALVLEPNDVAIWGGSVMSLII